MISITGHLGSGKSTVARMLAAWLGCPRFSTGDAQRKMAAERGITSLELNVLSETEPEIDALIDSASEGFAKENAVGVLDSRLAWHFVPSSFKVCLTVNPIVAATRVFSDARGPVESFGSIEEAQESLAKRRSSERSRYQKLYNVDVDRLANFDLIIDTSFLPPRSIRNAILASYNRRKKSLSFSPFLSSPQAIYPLAGDERVDGEVSVAYVDGQFFLLTGVSVLVFRLTEHRELFRAGRIWEGADVFAPFGATVREVVCSRFSVERMREWEAKFGFTFPGLPRLECP